jgi:hypothetical protein
VPERHHPQPSLGFGGSHHRRNGDVTESGHDVQAPRHGPGLVAPSGAYGHTRRLDLQSPPAVGRQLTLCIESHSSRPPANFGGDTIRELRPRAAIGFSSEPSSVGASLFRAWAGAASFRMGAPGVPTVDLT